MKGSSPARMNPSLALKSSKNGGIKMSIHRSNRQSDYTSNSVIIQDEIRKFLSVLVEKDDVFEVRVLMGRGVASGYYTLSNLGKLVQDLKAYTNYNIYVTLNKVNPALIARSKCRLKKYPEKTTSSQDIVRRRWLLVDVDPVRPTGICATEGEKHAAYTTAKEINQFLSRHGWPEALLVSSGNGYYLLYRVDLPNDEESSALIRSILSYLDLRFSNERAHVDPSVHNPDRLIRLCGTYNRKGDNTPDRPHRLCQVIHTPDKIVCVTREQMEEIASLLPQPQAEKLHTSNKKKKSSSGNLRAMLEAAGLEIKREKPFTDGTCYVLKECPFNHDHNDAAAYVIEFRNGAVAAGCHHASCSWTWQDLKEKILPPRPREEDVKDQQQTQQQEWEPALSVIAEKKPEKIEWLWEPFLPAGKLTVIEGDPGTGKTYVALALAAMLTQKGHNVIYATAEDGVSDTILPRLQAMQANLTRIYVLEGKRSTDGIVYHVTLKDYKVLEKAIASVRAKMIVFDPIQGFFGGGADFHKATEVRARIMNLVRIAAEQRCAVVAIRHLSKNTAASALHRGLGSIDISAAARSVLLVGQDSMGNRAVVQTKPSLSARGAAVGFEILDGDDGDVGVFRWKGEVDIKAEDLLRPVEENEKNAIQEAEEFLLALLDQGPVPAKEVVRQAKAVGVTRATLRRAKKRLGVISLKQGREKWCWSLPNLEGAQTEDAQREHQMSTFQETPKFKVSEGAQDDSEGDQLDSIYPLSTFKNHQKSQQNQQFTENFEDAHMSTFKKSEKYRDNNSLEQNLKVLKQVCKDDHLDEHLKNAKFVPELCRRCARLMKAQNVFYCGGSTGGNGGRPFPAFTFTALTEKIEECQYFTEKEGQDAS